MTTLISFINVFQIDRGRVFTCYLTKSCLLTSLLFHSSFTIIFLPITCFPHHLCAHNYITLSLLHYILTIITFSLLYCFLIFALLSHYYSHFNLINALLPQYDNPTCLHSVSNMYILKRKQHVSLKMLIISHCDKIVSTGIIVNFQWVLTTNHKLNNSILFWSNNHK